MQTNGISRPCKADLLILPVMALAFFIAFIPNIHYPYPVHIDEWVHVAHNDALLQAGGLDYPDPFTGLGTAGLVGILESGFHVLYGVFYRLSGLSWLSIVRYAPSFVFAFTVLSVYILARRERFGWEAAFFTCLIPTTVGIMGPAFFVPMALCLPFIPLSLFLVYNYRTPWSYLALLVFVCFMIVTHATSAIGLALIMVPCVLMYLKKEPRHGLILLLMGVVPFAITLPWTFGLIKSTAASLFIAKPLPVGHDLPVLVKAYGYVPFAMGLLGTFWLAFRGGVKNYSLVLGLLLMVALLAAFYSLHYGVDLVYLRGILYALLITGMLAGAGLMAVKDLALPERWKAPKITRKIGYPLSLGIVTLILVIAIPSRLNTPYYHMIEDNDYQTFLWVKENVGESYRKAILDPWQATPFAVITGKYVFTRIHVGPDATTAQAEEFLASGCRDTAFLRANGISIIVTEQGCDNPDLTMVREGVYLLQK
jgi:hypothetical protein